MLRHTSIAIVLAVLTVAPAAGQSQPAPAADAARGVIVTSGEGVVKATPDRVWVSIAAESRARNPKDAQRATADAMSAVTAKLKTAGLPPDAIRTTSYNLQPEFDYANGRQTLKGYVAHNTVEVRVDDVARAGEILDAAVGSGATSVSGVRFDLKDRVGAEREALRLAVADARARADAAASGAGLRVDRVVRIEEQRGFVQPRPMMMAIRESVQVIDAQPIISPGELDVRATVTLTTSIR